MRLSDRFSKSWLVAALLLASAALAVLGPGVAEVIRKPAHMVLAPLGDGGMFLTTVYKSHVSEVQEAYITQAEARRLKAENRALNAALERYIDAVGQWAALEQARLINQRYGPDSDFPCDLIPARVIADDALPYGATRIVSAGHAQKADDGAKVTTRVTLQTDRTKRLPPGLRVLLTNTDVGEDIPPRMRAVLSNVLVGELAETSAYTARCVLVTDREFRTEGLIHRVLDPAQPRFALLGGAVRTELTRANNHAVPVVAEGNGRGMLIVRNVSDEHGIAKDDILYTRGRERSLPVTIPIGQVERVEGDAPNPGFVILTVRPFADLSSLRDVYVVVPL